MLFVQFPRTVRLLLRGLFQARLPAGKLVDHGRNEPEQVTAPEICHRKLMNASPASLLEYY